MHKLKRHDDTNGEGKLHDTKHLCGQAANDVIEIGLEKCTLATGFNSLLFWNGVWHARRLFSFPFSSS